MPERLRGHRRGGFSVTHLHRPPRRISQSIRRKLQAAGVPVTWYPFDAGHEIPTSVVMELNTFLDTLRLAK